MPRSLPKKINPHILSGEAPAYDELVSRRGLGKTPIPIKAPQAGSSNGSKPENFGEFEYAHLHAKLPKDLKGSEIFPSGGSHKRPDAYFLMRRSKDGFVSATGMFKIAFPWAKQDEEKAERKYLKLRESETGEDEIAGNVWISPAFALELAKEYQLYDWVRALLDPREIAQNPSSGNKSSGHKQVKINQPPKFELPAAYAPQLSPTRTGSRRSASPSKGPASPRKSRHTKGTKDIGSPGTTATNESLQSSLDMTVSSKGTPSVTGTVATSVEPDGEEKKPKAASKSKKASRTSPTEKEGKEVKVKDEADHAKAVEMPILPEAPSTTDTERMITEAKEMVQQANKPKQKDAAPAESSSSKAAKKRKTDKLSDDEETHEASSQRVKRARVLEDKLKRERVRNRALVGVTAAFALAASIPYFF